MTKFLMLAVFLAIPRIDNAPADTTTPAAGVVDLSGRVAGGARLEVAHPAEASAGGKYTGLLRIVPVPADEATYGKTYESGYCQAMSYAGVNEIPAGYWVYAAPNWYVWQTAGHVKAAEDMANKQVTVYLDNGTPVAGQLIENTAEHVVLHMAAAGKKKLIYKAKITSIEWPAGPAVSRAATHWFLYDGSRTGEP